jgi:pimeloyl-ACP methyl ester carboxylesterase
MAPVARGLADSFRVWEPFQRPSGAAALAVADHVEDLRQLIVSLGVEARPALVGSSWGAMLALAFAAAHPDLAGPLVLIGCGTFDRVARARLHQTIDERMTPALRARLDRLGSEIADPGERLRATAELLVPVYSYNPITTELDLAECDARAHEETWADMLRLQEQGVCPAAFAAIRSPVLMLHGAHDPHPGPMIYESLRPYIPHLEYREWGRCGHYPWLERTVREEFFAVLKAWLVANTYASGRSSKTG